MIGTQPSVMHTASSPWAMFNIVASILLSGTVESCNTRKECWRLRENKWCSNATKFRHCWYTLLICAGGAVVDAAMSQHSVTTNSHHLKPHATHSAHRVRLYHTACQCFQQLTRKMRDEVQVEFVIQPARTVLRDAGDVVRIRLNKVHCRNICDSISFRVYQQVQCHACGGGCMCTRSNNKQWMYAVRMVRTFDSKRLDREEGRDDGSTKPIIHQNLPRFTPFIGTERRGWDGMERGHGNTISA